MTATDELHRMLDELRKLACDINEEEIRSHSIITLNQGRYNRQFRLDMNHDWLNAWHAEFERILQAIAATLGSCNCSNSERTDAPRLPHFWTHDGTLHIELPKLPESISVRLPDQRDREVGSARVWQYTRDSGTCHDEGDPGDFCCSECGVRMFTDTSDTYTMIAADERTIIKRPNYCPNCGREVVDDG